MSARKPSKFSVAPPIPYAHRSTADYSEPPPWRVDLGDTSEAHEAAEHVLGNNARGQEMTEEDFSPENNPYPPRRIIRPPLGKCR